VKISVLTFIAMLALASVGCNTKGEPADFMNACDTSKDGKTLEVTGFLEPRSTILCSNTGGRMECPFEFSESIGSDKKMTADIALGSGSNAVDEIPKGFKKEDLKVRDNSGSQIALGSDKLRLTGKMLVAPAAPGGSGVCLMQVYKIER